MPAGWPRVIGRGDCGDTDLLSVDAPGSRAPAGGLAPYRRLAVAPFAVEQDLALGEYVRALELDPGYIDALHERAKIHMAQNQWNPARRLLDRALDFDPNRVVVLRTMGRLYLERGFSEEALAFLARASPLAGETDIPLRAEILSLEARALADLGRGDEAREKLLAYHEFPFVQLLPWQAEVDLLKEKLSVNLPSRTISGNAWISPPTGAPLAIFTKVTGAVTLSNGVGAVWPAGFRTAVRRGADIRALPDAEATLVCENGGVVVITGAGSWKADDSLCGNLVAGADQLYELLLAELQRDFSSLGSLLKPATRSAGEGNHLILSPAGTTISSEPELVWTRVAGATAYEIVIDSDYGSLPLEVETEALVQESLKTGSRELVLYRLSWPEEPLWPEAEFSVRIVPRSATEPRRDFGELRSRSRVLDPKGASELQSAIGAIQTLDGNAFALAELRALAHEARGLWADALRARAKLAQERAWPGDRLGLGWAWLNLDGDAFARDGFREILASDPDFASRAAAEWGLGVVESRAGRYHEASRHLGRARALFQRLGRREEGLKVEAAMREVALLQSGASGGEEARTP